MDDALLALHFVGLMLGAGGGLGSMVGAQVANRRPPEQAGPIRSLGPILARMSSVGLVLMLATGVALVFVKLDGFDNVPDLLWVKLVFVATLTAAAIGIELTYARIKKGDMKAAALLPKLGPVAGISSLLAVITAAFAFH